MFVKIDNNLKSRHQRLYSVDRLVKQISFESQSYLRLYPIWDITKDHLKLLGYKTYKDFRLNIMNDIEGIDKLRVLNYAFDWCGIEVSKQIELNWVKYIR